MEKKSRTKIKEIVQDCRNTDDSKKQAGKERNLDLQLDLEKQDKDFSGAGAEARFSASKHHAQKQQPRGARAEPRTEKAAEPLPLPMLIPGWPGGFPPFGYMTQVPLPPFGPVDASTSSSKIVQSLFPSQLWPKCYATHCYIAQNIHYHQQMTKLHPYCPTEVSAAPFYASKQYNLSTASLSNSTILKNPKQHQPPTMQPPTSLLRSLRTRNISHVTVYRGNLELRSIMKITVWVYKKTVEDKGQRIFDPGICFIHLPLFR